MGSQISDCRARLERKEIIKFILLFFRDIQNFDYIMIVDYLFFSGVFMKSLKSGIVLFLALVSIANAQQVKLGFKFEMNLLQWTGHRDSYNDVKISEIQVNLSYFTSQRFAMEARIGLDGPNERYTGIDYGVLGKYHLQDNIFLTGGILMHNYLGDSRTFGGRKIFVFPSIGFVANPFGVSVEALFLYGANQYSNEFQKFAGVWKLGVGYNFNL